MSPIIDENVINEMVKLRSSIIQEWVNNCEIKKILDKLGPEYNHFFIDFGYWRFDRIIDKLMGVSNLLSNDSMKVVEFVKFLDTHKIKLRELVFCAVGFRNIFIKYLLEIRKFEYEVIKLVIDIFDKNFSGVLAVYDNFNMDKDKLLEQYVNAIDEASIATKTDLKGRITYANDNFCNLSGYTRDEVIGKNHNIVRHPDMPKEVFRELRNTIQNKNVWQGIIKNRKKDGGYYWVVATVVPLLDANDNIKEYISIRHDITTWLEDIQSKQLESNKARNDAELANIQKTKLLNVVTHDLRAPITSIRGYLSMMIDGDLGSVNPETMVYVKKIYDTSTRLIEFINNLLDIRKLESGNVDFVFEDVDMFKLISDVVFENQIQSSQKSQKLWINISYENLVYNTDLVRMRQVISNLVNNAIKYTPSGGEILVRSFVQDGKLIIGVKDNGIGIANENIGKIFEEFGQVKDETTKNIVGTGLGLSIVKLIVEKLGGTIEVKSQLGEGSEFLVKFPLK